MQRHAVVQCMLQRCPRACGFLWQMTQHPICDSWLLSAHGRGRLKTLAEQDSTWSLHSKHLAARTQYLKDLFMLDRALEWVVLDPEHTTLHTCSWQ